MQDEIQVGCPNLLLCPEVVKLRSNENFPIAQPQSLPNLPLKSMDVLHRN